MKRILIARSYCASVAKSLENNAEEKLDFKKLRHISKVSDQPVNETFNISNQELVEIDKRTLQLLERLSLVNLDGKEALKTLKSSLQFAKKIKDIDTTNIKPLYTVLENESLSLRDDEVKEGNCREDILRNAKITEEDYFISPPGNIPLKQE